MKIDYLYLSDFRGITKLKLKFDSQSTVLFGINGAGKTSVLSAINVLYAMVIGKIVKQRFKQGINLELTDIKNGKASTSIEVGLHVKQQSFEIGRMITHDNRRINLTNELDKLMNYLDEVYIGEVHTDEMNNLIYNNPDFSLPIFANYGVNRLVLKTPLRFRKKPATGQYATYENAIANQIDFDKLFMWCFDEEFFEALQKKENPEYRNKKLWAVKKAMLAMLDHCTDIHIVGRPYSMKITKDGEVLDILQLSDGEKCTLALFGDIARRLALANPSLANPLLGEGVVLIDELELHMHVQWQRKVLRVLKETFPNIQFIITTHSPQILGEINQDYQIYALKKDGDEISTIEIDSLYGMDSNAVLEDYLNTDCVTSTIKKKVEQMYSEIEQKNYDEAEKVADFIDEQTLSRNKDTVRARLIIQRGKRKNAKN